MDTSTLSITDVVDADLSPASLTAVQYSDRIQPGVEWLTRLISPLTRHTADPSSPPLSPVTMTSAVAVPLAKAMEVESWEGGNAVLEIEEVMRLYRADMEHDQVPYPSQPQIPAPREPSEGSGNQGSGMNNMLLIFIPMLAVVLTVLLGLLVFLVAMLYMKRRRGIR
jgi:hypothetical protein